jgi:chromosome segregation ATPase
MRALTEELRRQIARLDEASQAGEAALTECRTIEARFREVETAAREDRSNNLTAVAQHVDRASQSAGESQTAASAAASAEQRCADIRDALNSALDANGRRMSEVLQQAEAHAVQAKASTESTASAVDTAKQLRGECEDLLKTLRLKGEELTAAWQAVEQALPPQPSSRASEAETAAAAPAPPASPPPSDPHWSQLQDRIDALTDLVVQRVHSAEKEISLFRKSSRSLWKRIKWLLVGIRPS